MSKHMHPPIGKLINIGSHQLHIHATGKGSPSVIFESGGASWSMDWYLVQTEVAEFTLACSYDRAGFGWSEPGPKPRTCDQMVAELHELLTKAEIPKPYILVGASFGGHIVRLFAKKFPDEVVGVILVDARHESIDSKMPPAWKAIEKVGKNINQFMLLASKLGLLQALGKLMGEKGAPPILTNLPPESRRMYLEIGFQTKYFQTNFDELEAVTESDRQLHLAGSLGEIPLTVIRHGNPDLFSRMPAEQAKQSEQVWQEMQAELAKLSSKSKLLVAEKSGHGIQIEQPDLVIHAIKQMVEAVK